MPLLSAFLLYLLFPCSAGLDQDQFIRLLREPGQQWTVWDIWQTEANGGDGVFPTAEELEQLDGIVITGDRCADK